MCSSAGLYLNKYTTKRRIFLLGWSVPCWRQKFVSLSMHLEKYSAVTDLNTSQRILELSVETAVRPDLYWIAGVMWVAYLLGYDFLE
jgi:hypothetical protein